MTAIQNIEDFPQYINADMPLVVPQTGLTFPQCNYFISKLAINLPYIVKPNGEVVVTELLKMDIMWPIKRIYPTVNAQSVPPTSNSYFREVLKVFGNRDAAPITARNEADEAHPQAIDQEDRSFYGEPDSFQSKNLVAYIGHYNLDGYAGYGDSAAGTKQPYYKELLGDCVQTHDFTVHGKGALICSDVLRLNYEITCANVQTVADGVPIPSANATNTTVSVYDLQGTTTYVQREFMRNSPSIRVWYRLRTLSPWQHVAASGKFVAKTLQNATPYLNSRTFVSQAP